MTVEQIREIVARTGVDQVHLSARSVRESAMVFRKPEVAMGATVIFGEYERKVADAEVVRVARGLLGGGEEITNH